MGWFRGRELGGIMGARARLAQKTAGGQARTRLQGLDGFDLPGEDSAAIARKDAEGLAAKFGNEEHPFSACMSDPDLQKQYPDEEQRARVCGAMKAIVHEGEQKQKAERMNNLIRGRIR